MPVSPARAIAFDILMRVEQHGAYASELLHSGQFDQLSAADHALATQLTMGVVRWKSTLDAILASRSSQNLARLDTEVLTTLRLGLYQIHFLERIPARAAIFESVELVKRARKRSAASFVNALLRTLQALPGVVATPVAHNAATLAASTAHPHWLLERWIEQYGLEQARAICTHDQTIPTTSIHLFDPTAEDELIEAGIKLRPGALLANARGVADGDVTKTAAYTARRIAIQDEASQLVALLVGLGRRILDCCAAPGGKTRLMAARNPGAQLVAMDIHPHRAALLRRLAPGQNIHVVSADARAMPLSGEFDRILADVPCSGTGTLAHNPEIKWRLKEEDILHLASRQSAILRAALERLAPGGTVLYSTCSLESEENEMVVEQAIANSAVELVNCRDELVKLRNAGELVAPDLDSLVSGSYLRTIPGVHPCDGFFAAVLKKNAEHKN